MFLLYLLLWIVLNGRITLEIILLGILISLAITALSYRLLKMSLDMELLVLRNVPLMLLYTLNLILEIFKSSLAVMKVSVGSRTKPQPVIVEFDSGFTTRFQNVLLANSITLTPGTYTLFQEDDHFVVHCLRPEYAEGMHDSSFVHLLKKMKL